MYVCRESLDRQLRKRLHHLRLSPGEVRQNKDIVSELREKILEELKKSSQYRLHDWDTINSGSYYDKTKVNCIDHSFYTVQFISA